MKSLLMLLLCLCGGSIFAQVDGTIKLVISPKDAFVRIDGKVVEVSKENTLRLPAGEHEIEIWAPRFEVFKEVVTISPGKELDYRKGLTVLNNSYNDYRETGKIYRKAKLERNLTIGGIIVANAITTVMYQSFTTTSIDRKKKNAEEVQRAYDLAVEPDQVTRFENQYNTAKEEYEQAVDRGNSIRKFGTPLLIAGYGLSAYFLVKIIKKKTNRPGDFTPENPFLTFMEKYEPTLLAGANQVGVGVNLKF